VGASAAAGALAASHINALLTTSDADAALSPGSLLLPLGAISDPPRAHTDHRTDRLRSRHRARGLADGPITPLVVFVVLVPVLGRSGLLSTLAMVA
jgi:hypothetical protein